VLVGDMALEGKIPVGSLVVGYAYHLNYALGIGGWALNGRGED